MDDRAPVTMLSMLLLLALLLGHSPCTAWVPSTHTYHGKLRTKTNRVLFAVNAGQTATTPSPIIKPTNQTIVTNLIHSEDQLRLALSHLLKTGLEGHETMTLYRNVRRKYDTEGVLETKEGLRQVRTFRSIEEGVLAAYEASCCTSIEQAASALYVTINPRHVPNALKSTHELYFKWVEHKAGASKQEVRRGSTKAFAGTLDRAFAYSLSNQQSRSVFNCIDVDDPDPNTWLKKIRHALGDDKAIEMVIETRGGFHVVYNPGSMDRDAHLALARVIQSDADSKDDHVTKLVGSAVSCPLPGTFQGHHATRILQCSCDKNPALLPALEEEQH